MTRTEILLKMNDIFKDILDNDALSINESTTASEVEGWDSLNHINIMGQVQKEFKIRFHLKEISSFRNVGEIVTAIEGKLI